MHMRACPLIHFRFTKFPPPPRPKILDAALILLRKDVLDQCNTCMHLCGVNKWRLYGLTCALLCDWVQVVRLSINSRQITLAAAGTGKAHFTNAGIGTTTIQIPSQSVLNASCKQRHHTNMNHILSYSISLACMSIYIHTCMHAVIENLPCTHTR